MAQVTTLPVLTIPFAFSGLLFPLALLPEPLRWLAQALPLRPEVTLMRLGLTGTAAGGHHLGMAATFGAAAIPDDSRPGTGTALSGSTCKRRSSSRSVG
jgi:hypothetical protein